jgi:hypothetical protein
METGNFLMPLSEFERRAECIAADGSYIYLRRSLPRDRLIATGARVFLPTHVITMVDLVLYELGTNALEIRRLCEMGPAESSCRSEKRYPRLKLSAYWCFRCTYTLRISGLIPNRCCPTVMPVLNSPPAGRREQLALPVIFQSLITWIYSR